MAGPTPASFGYDAAGNLISSSTVGSLEHDTRLRLVRATVGNTVTDYKLNALGQRVAKSGATDKYFHYDGDGRLIAESDAAVRVQKEYVWLGDTPIAMIESAPPPAGPTCPATPELRRPGGFTPYERRERMEVHSGRPDERGWEWALGENTRDFEASAREDLNWISGKPYAFRLTYDGKGNAQAIVLKTATIVLSMRARRTSNPPQLVDVLIGAYRRRILALLLLHPERSFYVREMERLTRVPAGSLHRELKLLTDAGFLARSVSGNQVRYQAERTNPIFDELAGILRKTAGLAGVLRDLLAPLSDAIRVAFVFGSVAQGKERATSDVDVMVVGAVGFAQVVEALAPGRDRLQREINPTVMTVDAFRTKLAAKDRFVSRLAREPKIFLLGGADELAELAEDRAAQRTSGRR